MKTNNPLRPKTYPDISHILVEKAQRRLALAALSWEEKVAIVEQMRQQSPRKMWRPKTGPAPEQSQQGAGQKA
jgi:hypothetical protein